MVEILIILYNRKFLVSEIRFQEVLHTKIEFFKRKRTKSWLSN